MAPVSCSSPRSARRTRRLEQPLADVAAAKRLERAVAASCSQTTEAIAVELSFGRRFGRGRDSASLRPSRSAASVDDERSRFRRREQTRLEFRRQRRLLPDSAHAVASLPASESAEPGADELEVIALESWRPSPDRPSRVASLVAAFEHAERARRSDRSRRRARQASARLRRCASCNRIVRVDDDHVPKTLSTRVSAARTLETPRCVLECRLRRRIGEIAATSARCGASLLRSPVIVGVADAIERRSPERQRRSAQRDGFSHEFQIGVRVIVTARSPHLGAIAHQRRAGAAALRRRARPAESSNPTRATAFARTGRTRREGEWPARSP